MPSKKQVKVKFGSWELKVVHSRQTGNDQIECRKDFRAQISFPANPSMNGWADDGRCLIIVTEENGDWLWKNQRGSSDVRISMNAACCMSRDEVKEMYDIIDYARELINTDPKQRDTIMMLGDENDYRK